MRLCLPGLAFSDANFNASHLAGEDCKRTALSNFIAAQAPESQEEEGGATENRKDASSQATQRTGESQRRLWTSDDIFYKGYQDVFVRWGLAYTPHPAHCTTNLQPGVGSSLIISPLTFLTLYFQTCEKCLQSWNCDSWLHLCGCSSLLVLKEPLFAWPNVRSEVRYRWTWSQLEPQLIIHVAQSRSQTRSVRLHAPLHQSARLHLQFACHESISVSL